MKNKVQPDQSYPVPATVGGPSNPLRDIAHKGTRPPVVSIFNNPNTEGATVRTYGFGTSPWNKRPFVPCVARRVNRYWKLAGDPIPDGPASVSRAWPLFPCFPAKKQDAKLRPGKSKIYSVEERVPLAVAALASSGSSIMTVRKSTH
ncbi:hypothetical protein K0M31_015573 [Melipona bicolor]|uniref:Uncharacterized protein n=1 Tax=Melipona bicolor TaxID=60889 RepID=A0AA40KF78_9HYME|nr:hypothetical protein K0M31_015573 [Melipona bicolor]